MRRVNCRIPLVDMLFSIPTMLKTKTIWVLNVVNAWQSWTAMIPTGSGFQNLTAKKDSFHLVLFILWMPSKDNVRIYNILHIWAEKSKISPLEIILKCHQIIWGKTYSTPNRHQPPKLGLHGWAPHIKYRCSLVRSLLINYIRYWISMTLPHSITEGINRGQPRNNVPNTFNAPPHHYPISMSTNGLPPPGVMPHNQPYHSQSQKMPMQQPWSGGSAGSSGTYY